MQAPADPPAETPAQPTAGFLRDAHFGRQLTIDISFTNRIGDFRRQFWILGFKHNADQLRFTHRLYRQPFDKRLYQFLPIPRGLT